MFYKNRSEGDGDTVSVPSGDGTHVPDGSDVD